MTNTRSFMDGAKGLAKNPLGIIALFIALIYGFATLLLGLTVTGLQPSERKPLIWFVVLFPVVVLVAFFRLVTKHHGKLYAPSDFGNDDSFLKTLSPHEQEARIDEEIASIEIANESRETTAPNSVHGTSEVVIGPMRGTAQGIVQPPEQRTSSREQYILAETLAIQKISKDSGLIFRPQVSFGQGRATAFDAVAQENDSFTAIEVKFIRRAFVMPSIFREALYRAVVASNLVTKRSPDHTFKFILAIVTDIESQKEIDTLTRQVSSLMNDTPITVELKIFTLKELMHEFNNSTPA